MKLSKALKSNVQSMIIILLVALLFVSPQFFLKFLIIGSDSIFHFNRFYDTAAQIKNGNFQYFISMYGFQQSGRIVNALYGPLMAYLQGFLVLLTPSWFVYQIVANLILYLVAGMSMFTFLKKLQVKNYLSICSSIVFMSSFSIQYWITRQGFSSWGAAFFPLCLMPLMALEKSGKFHPLHLGFAVALMTQIHLLSALMLVFIYMIYFLYALQAKKSKPIDLWSSVFKAIGVFLVLTSNIWYSMLVIYRGNQLLAPFVNKKMYLNTITADSYYWLITPVFLILIILFKFQHDLRFWKKYSGFEKTTSLIMIILFLLTTNLVPWKFLSEHHVIGVDLIQFPFRFFVPFTVLLLLAVAEMVDKRKKQARKWCYFFATIAVIQTLGVLLFFGSNWRNDSPTLFEGKYITAMSEEKQAIKETFFSKDKTLSLKMIEKSTPDYLPLYAEDNQNKYTLYQEKVLDENNKFHKEVVGHELVISWTSRSTDEISVPVIVYNRTRLTMNGSILKTADLNLSTIGTPSVKQKIGKNVLQLHYQRSFFFDWLLFLPIIGCFFFFVRFIWTIRSPR